MGRVVCRNVTGTARPRYRQTQEERKRCRHAARSRHARVLALLGAEPGHAIGDPPHAPDRLWEPKWILQCSSLGFIPGRLVRVMSCVASTGVDSRHAWLTVAAAFLAGFVVFGIT